MNKVPDRKKLRREYLKRKGKAYGSVACVIVAALAFLFLNTRIIHLPHGVLRDVLQGALGGIVLGQLLFPAYKKKLAAAKQIPYVPPVTPSTLPAEEVLVRSSTEPDAPQEPLLRAAQGDEESKPDELLRSHLP